MFWKSLHLVGVFTLYIETEPNFFLHLCSTNKVIAIVKQLCAIHTKVKIIVIIHAKLMPGSFPQIVHSEK